MVGSNEQASQPNPEMAAADGSCSHRLEGADPTPRTDGCEECLAAGMTWVHLRLCLSCGHVGCCDDSKGRHATRHFEEAGHPVIRSHEPGERWCWCYADETEP